MPASGYELHQSPLYRLENHRKLAALLKVSLSELHQLRHGDSFYTEFDIPKKTGGTRHVENPKTHLKRVQSRLSRVLSRIAPPDYLFCPVKRRSYVGNAAQHLQSRVVRCLDVRKYFPSTPAWRVNWFFRKVMRCSPDVADTLTRLATYQGHLPTGSPLSPIMAFFAHYDVWERVAKIARANGLVLTIYIDDVTLSGQRVPTRVVWEIKKTIFSSGLKYHKEKWYVDRPAEITGAIVSSQGLRAPNRQQKKLYDAERALIELGTAPNSDPRQKVAILNRISGLRGQLRQIRAFDDKSSPF